MDDLVTVRLTDAQVRLIESIVAIPEDLEKSLHEAFQDSEGQRYAVSYTMLDHLLGWVAAEANREEAMRRRRMLDRVYREVQLALWEFDDQRIANGEPVPVGVLSALEDSGAGAKKKRRSRKS